MIPLVSAEQMRALDNQTIEKLGITGGVLMETAGRGVVEVLWRLHSEGALDLFAGQVVVVAGPGNNGGDGMVVARYLHSSGVTVKLLLCAERARVKGDALRHLQAAEELGVLISEHSGDSRVTVVVEHLTQLSKRDIVVDALLGTGLSRPAEGPLQRVILAINDSAAVKLSVDLPSGMDADRGLPADSADPPAVVRADYTVTLGFCKLGLASAPGFAFAGKQYLVDIGIPATFAAQHGVCARLLDESCLQRLLQPRSPLGHKGSHGHLLVIAGSRGKTGAAQLCTKAALTVGVGLCSLAVPAEVLDAIVAQLPMEAMTQPYDADSPTLSSQLLTLAAGKQALVIGPGLPVSGQMKQSLLTLLAQATMPLVLDADALNQLCGEDAALLRATQLGRQVVLTPHPGEAARLLGWTVAQVQADRLRSAQQLCQRTGAVVVLKGARTLIVAPAGADTQQVSLSVCPTGNAGMGSGGMGDVLAGMVGALLTAGWPAYEAACAAVYWHGFAGDCTARLRAVGSVLLAGDLIGSLDTARRAALHQHGRQRQWPVMPL